MSMQIHRFRRLPSVLLSLGLFGLTAACSTNPATGKSQLALIGEQQEIALGREADQQTVASLGLYPDDGLQAYVSGLGQQLARGSERPGLPWSFRVVDDPVVNAFALPGGFLFVTRGLLGHLTSEAELAAVLGHEIGHVTARHGVEQMSRAQLAQIGLLAGAIAAPEAAQAFGGLAQQGLGLLFLKYGRDDERQADDLGFRYLVAQSYDPREMPKVFDTLRRVSEKQGAGRIPAWLSTHPAPEDRIQRISAKVAGVQGDLSARTVNRDPYLQHLERLTFGDNPREGYVVGNRFIQPELGIQLRFPEGWKVNNQKQSVSALSPGQDAVAVLTLAQQSSPQEAERAFFSQSGIQQGSALTGDARHFTVQQQSGGLEGLVDFVEQGGRVFALLGYTTQGHWGQYQRPLADTVASFSRVTERRLLDVEPKRLALVKLPAAMSLEEFAQRYPSTVDLETLAIVNGVAANAAFPAGSLVKRVVGGQLPR